MEIEQLKRLAGEQAAAEVSDGTVVGLGTGSTAVWAIRRLGERVRAGLRIVGVPTSEASRRLAEIEGIPLATLDSVGELDLDLDGADQIDPDLNLIKGYGGALLREKLVALAARRFIVVADDSKLVHHLGEHGPVPVEVVRFAWHTTRVRIEQLGCHVELRRQTSGDPFVTDEGHYVLDCHFAAIEHPQEIAQALKSLVGVVEHGLFLGIATDIVIAHRNGTVEWRQHSY